MEITGMEMAHRIRDLFHTVIRDPELHTEIHFLMKTLHVTEQQLLDAWVYWDTSIKTYGNEVYSSAALRLAMHLHQYLDGSWHQKRQQTVLRYLQQTNPGSICELGFGTPQAYVREALQKKIRLTLGDVEQSSIDFANVLLPYWAPHEHPSVNLIPFDFNTDSLPNNHDVYLFQDSIEHARNPSNVLTQYVQQASQGASFLFSLPIEIEHPIPEHHICWNDEQDVLHWLAARGLTVLDHTTIHMNKDVDLFSLSLHPRFREVVVSTRKR